jgi:hypothetical protein
MKRKRYMDEQIAFALRQAQTFSSNTRIPIPTREELRTTVPAALRPQSMSCSRKGPRRCPNPPPSPCSVLV